MGTCSLRLRVYNNIYDNECPIYKNMPTFFVQAGIANTVFCLGRVFAGRGALPLFGDALF